MNRTLKLLAVLAVFAFCLQTFSDNKADVDLWGNVGFVKSLPWQDGFHHANTFSFTEPSHAWTNHEWLSEYILHHTHARLGNVGLLGLKIVLGLAVVFLLNMSMRSDCPGSEIRFLFLLLVISTMGYGFSTRPHLFTYVLYSLFLLLLKRKGSDPIVLCVLMPVLAVVWTNLHGAFFVGALLLVVFTVAAGIPGADAPSGGKGLPPSKPGASEIGGRHSHGASRRQAFAWPALGLVLFLAASLVNPYGAKLWEFIGRTGQVARPYLSEWAPFHPLRDLGDHHDFVILAVMTITGVVLARVRRQPVWLALLVLSLAAAILMRRNIPLFAITAAFVAPRYLHAVAGADLARLASRVPRVLLVLALAAFIAASAHSAATFNKTDPLEIEVPEERFPVDAIDYMQRNGISGNALVFFDWAEYCIWKLYPDCRVFLDGRFLSAYGSKTVTDYFGFLYLSEGWEKALDEYPTDIVLVHSGNPVCGPMLRREGWTLVFKTEIAALFLKNSEHEEFLDRLAAGETQPPAEELSAYFP